MKGLLVATTFLTRVPVPVRLDWPRDLARSVPWFPVVGVAVGAVVGSVTWALALVIPSLAAAAIATGAGMLVTGGFHEDGLADTFDGLGGGSDRERALEIMRDSRLGTFGTAALLVAMVSKIAILAAFEGPVVVVVAAVAGGVGRAISTAWMRTPARTEGLGASYLSVIGRSSVVAAVVVGLVVSLGMGVVALVAVPLAAGVSGLVGVWAHHKIGGVTGDVLGGIVVVAEIVVLATAAAVPGMLPW